MLANDTERWVCTKSCKAYQKHVDRTIIDKDLQHNHEADPPKVLMRQKIANACKRKAVDDLFERPSKVMRREMTADALEILTEADWVQIWKSIYGARANERPPLPKNLDELHRAVNEIELKTKLDEQFLLVNDDIGYILMFSTQHEVFSLV